MESREQCAPKNCQREMKTIKSTEHGNGIVAPYAHVTPNNVLRNAHDPAGHPGIAGINKLPAPPKFSSRRRADHIRIIVGVATEAIFMTVVPLARIKGIVLQVLPYIGFERPIICGFQTGWRSCVSPWKDMKIDQVFVVAGRLSIEVPFRHFVARGCRARALDPNGNEDWLNCRVRCRWESTSLSLDHFRTGE
jgi:hypothetical protein